MSEKQTFDSPPLRVIGHPSHKLRQRLLQMFPDENPNLTNLPLNKTDRYL